MFSFSKRMNERTNKRNVFYLLTKKTVKHMCRVSSLGMRSSIFFFDALLLFNTIHLVHSIGACTISDMKIFYSSATFGIYFNFETIELSSFVNELRRTKNERKEKMKICFHLYYFQRSDPIFCIWWSMNKSLATTLWVVFRANKTNRINLKFCWAIK